MNKHTQLSEQLQVNFVCIVTFTTQGKTNVNIIDLSGRPKYYGSLLRP